MITLNPAPSSAFLHRHMSAINLGCISSRQADQEATDMKKEVDAAGREMTIVPLYLCFCLNATYTVTNPNYASALIHFLFSGNQTALRV